MTKKASLDWTKINRDIKISYTKKKFFNEYYYRLNYFVPGARLICFPLKEGKSLHDRVLTFNQNSMRWYKMFGERYADYNQIKDFFEIYQNKDSYESGKIKFRIESQTFGIYSDSENTLYDIAVNHLPSWHRYTTSISLIENQKDLELLDQGNIIVNKPQTHPYRIKIKETFSFSAERQSLLSYVKNLDSQVRASKYILERLSSGHKYFPGGYIHVSDERLVDMLRLIAPNLIGTVNKLVTQ